MNKRKFIWTAIAALVLLVAIAVSFGLFSTEPTLTIHLRCESQVSGKLSVAMILPNGESGKAENFDIETVCKANKIELSDYTREKKLQFILKRDDGKTNNLVSEYGSNIQSDQNGFYLILKITKTSPFISNERL